MKKQKLRFLTDLGLRVEVVREKKHVVAKITDPQTGKSMLLTLSKTPSDYRGDRNNIARVRRQFRRDNNAGH